MASLPSNPRSTHGSGRLTAAVFLLAASSALFIPSEVHAQHVTGPRAAGMGGSHRGVGTGNDTIYLNPAGMSLFPRYVVESFWKRRTGRNETLFGISVLDSATTQVAAGLSYTYDYAGSGGSIRSGSRLDVSSSYPVSQWLLFGTTVRYLQMSTEDGAVQRITFDSGLILRLGEAINVGVVGHNLWNPTDRGGVAPRAFGVGIGVVPLRNMVLAFDYRIDPDRDDRPAMYSAGAEYFFLGSFGLRGGWNRDDRLADQQISFGASYVEETYGLDVSYGRSLEGEPGYELGIGLRLFVR